MVIVLIMRAVGHGHLTPARGFMPGVASGRMVGHVGIQRALGFHGRKLISIQPSTGGNSLGKKRTQL